jgi:hypothetical protein
MSNLQLAVIRSEVHPDLEIKVHIIENGRLAYDEGHSVFDDGHLPQPDHGKSLRWIHVPTNNMAHVAVRILLLLRLLADEPFVLIPFVPTCSHVSPSVTPTLSSPQAFH